MVLVIAAPSGAFAKPGGSNKPPLSSRVFGKLWRRCGALGTTTRSSRSCCRPQRRTPASMEGACSTETTINRMAAMAATTTTKTATT